MRFRPICIAVFALAWFARPAYAQLPPAQPDPLAKMRAAAGPACSATEPSLCSEANPKIIANALGPSPMEENLRRLTDEIGGRPTGTPAMARAVDWAVQAFRAAGVQEVHTETYSIPLTWSEGETKLEIVDSNNSPIQIVSLGWSPATPDGGITAPLVDIGSGEAADFERAGGSVRGAIVLIHSEVLRTWDDLFNEYARAPGIVERAVHTGAAAILWMSTREQKLLYRHIDSLDGKLGPLPEAIVAREDAERLARFAAAGSVRVRLEMPNRIGPGAQQQNVVAEIRGREKPDEYVVLGAHLDSWELGTGALDNGCNAAMVIEAARDIVASGVAPRRSIRFVLFSGEEQGMLGSYAYVRAHREEMDRVAAAVIFDEGIGRVTGFSLGGRHDVEPALREILKPIESWGVSQDTFDAPVGTDNFDYLLEGVPTLIANQDAANYIVNYHAASDTFDKVDMRELKLHAAIAAITAFGIAERPERIGPRQSRAQIESLMKETGLDQQMRSMGFWPAWESGARGRQKQ
ncbi:MAG TPA: M20/M25/M40 family metallo-hydrolase [Candidatus Acidoferrales bacterium]|nr:M20/M25/M40 family metallo-hydrolase [Candidatus Acidoferrales bacterium]